MRQVRAWAVVLGAVVLAIGLAPIARADDARHYEKVSPADKGQGDIIGDGGTNVASLAGDAVTLSSRTPFGDTIGSGVSGQTQYVVRRTAGGWVAHAITPQPRADAYQTFFGPTRFQAFSADLSTGVLFAYDLPAASGDVPLRNNLYVEDFATRALQPVTMAQGGFPNPLPHPVFENSQDADWGISADARHVAFVSRVPYLASAATNGTVFGPPNVYQWDDGVLSLAGILPDGTVPTNGSDAALPLYRGSMSADGRRLLFIASTGGPNQLYQRVNGSRTVWVSEPEIDPSDPNLPPDYVPDPSGVRLQAVTPDGRNVFFTTASPLRREDQNGSTDLYRWTASDNPSSDANLTMISENGNQDGTQVAGVSDDGQRVYYQTLGADLVVWDHGADHVIQQGGVGIPGAPEEQLAATAARPGFGRVTPDGRYLAFAYATTGDIGITGEVTNSHREMYLYSLDDDRLQCISCPARPAMADIAIAPEATTGVISYTMPGIRPRFLSDGGQVFFSTAEALVPEDINGVADTYEYDPATDKVRLVSSGKGSDPATFTDASASGDDVFFVTRQHLVNGDKDDLVDLYDARIGDALPDEPVEAPTPSCEGETCQPPPAAAPPEDLLGSLLFDDGVSGASHVAGLSARRRLVLHGTSGTLRVKLTAGGMLRWSGNGLRSGSVRRSRSGTLVLHLRLDRRARARLRKAGSYTTSVHLTLTSATTDVSRTTRVTFRAAAKKGR